MNTNGVISFLTPESRYTPVPFPFNQRHLIAPFWGDVDTSKGGTVFYRESTDTALLKKATQDIRRAFNATWIFIATWDRVAFYGSSGNMRNKVTIDNKRWTLINFKQRCECFGGAVIGRCPWSVRVQIHGLSPGRGNLFSLSSTWRTVLMFVRLFWIKQVKALKKFSRSYLRRRKMEKWGQKEFLRTWECLNCKKSS